MKVPRRDGQRNWQPTSIPLTINELLRPSLLSPYSMMMMLPLLLLLSITMRPTAAIMAPPLPHHHHHQHQYHQARSNYHEPHTEAFAGLAAGYASASTRQNYYGAADGGGQATLLLDVDGGVGDLAAAAEAPYANYETKAVSSGSGSGSGSALGGTASGFVPPTTAALYNYNNYNSNNNNNNNNENRLQSEGKIDFVINTANYELDVNEEQQQQQQQHQSDVYYPSYSYQPGAPQLQPLPQQPPFHDYHIEQFSNYRHGGGEQERVSVQQHSRQVNDDSPLVYREQRHDFNFPHKRQQRAKEPKQHQRQPHQQLDDQQLLYSQSQSQIQDIHGNYHSILPPITTSVHHTASSSKAIAGLPLTKHIEITKQVPITHYQQQHVPFKQPIEIRVPRPVIAAIPKPIPIKIPVSKTVAVPQLQEVKIPVEKVKPFAVERPIPFVVERRVPYRVEKAVATPFYYPYPIKVPIVRTVVHKQRPQYTLPSPGFGSFGAWSTGNHLLGLTGSYIPKK